MSSKPSGPKASLLVLGSNWINCLLPSTLITQADALLQNHKLEDAVALADQQLKKFQSRVTVDQDEADELRYIYQRLGFQCLTETLFDDAGKHFFAGHLDPRVLVSYYPELCGSLFDGDDDETADVFAGVAEHMPPETTIDDIIAINLVRNYSPHLAPNTSTAPPAVELRKILRLAATDMLKAFLRKWRTKRRREEIEKDRRVNEVVDTVLAKLHTHAGETTDLLALIDGANSTVLPELEPVLIDASRLDALCRLYRTREEHAKLLNAWSKLISGEWIDEDVHDPLGSMLAFLTEKRDKALVQEWCVWLLKYNVEEAMKLLTSLGTAKRGLKAAGDDAALLRRIQEADPAAGTKFLEHLVLQKRSIDPEKHSQLALEYVEQMVAYLQEPATSKVWRAKASAYASHKADEPFVSYFASTAPDSEATRVRLKTILFLQGSKFYDATSVCARLEECEGANLLGLEHAILYGKLARHREALHTLVHIVHDSASAEVYCTLGGEVVPPRIAQAVGERYGLQAWSALFVSPQTGLGGRAGQAQGPIAAVLSREKTVDEGLKRELTRVLLEVYMSAGSSMSERAAQLLDAQAVNLDVVDVLAIIPPEWPLLSLSSFVTRSFRRALHARHEGQLVKAIAASQNLAVAEETWVVLREQGAVVEEAAEDDGEGEGELDEKGLAEKLGLALNLNEKVELHELHPGEDGGGGLT